MCFTRLYVAWYGRRETGTTVIYIFTNQPPLISIPSPSLLLFFFNPKTDPLLHPYRKSHRKKWITHPKRKPTVTKPGSSFRPRVQTQPNRPQPHSQPQPHHRFQSQPNRPQLQTQHNRPQPQSQPQTRPRVQSQTNRPLGVYRPQMYDSSSPLMDYNQPLPPLPEDFNPFSDTRTNHPHTVENEGMGDDWFEQVHTVPETPMYNVEEVDDEEMEVEELGAEEEQVVVEVESRPKKAEKRKWESEEEEALAKSWIKISTDKLVGDRQTKEGFWKRVLKHYQSLIPGSNRTKDQVNSKWTLMNAAMVAFNGYYSQAVWFIRFN